MLKLPPKSQRSELVAIVADSSSLIGLHAISRLNLLQSIYGEVIIPPAVAREVQASVPLPVWIVVQAPMPDSMEFPSQLGPGEREALLLASQIHPEALLVDDLPARRTAVRLGLHLSEVVGTLIAAKRLGCWTKLAPISTRSAQLRFISLQSFIAPRETGR
jgi:predicted nucleic acid-binding protein